MVRAGDSRIKDRQGGPSRMTSELGLEHESEPAMGSPGIGVFKDPRAGRDLAGGVSKGRPVW